MMKNIIGMVLGLAVVLAASACSAAENDSGNASSFIPDAGRTQTIYFWDEGNVPATTSYTVNNGNYFDPPEFRPNMIFYPADEGTQIRGAVMINPGGAFMFRGDNEGAPVARMLNHYGYQCFVVNYRLRPYTQEEGALDLARGIRFVRKHADIYGIDPRDIASIGFSAGGILSGEVAMNFDGLVNGTAIDSGYVPDELDQVSADLAAEGMFYSFYGRLSVASLDVDKFREAELPPTYVCYGSNEVFRGQIENHIVALREAGIPVETNMLEGLYHGFASNGGWGDDFDRWLSGVFVENGGELTADYASAELRGGELTYSLDIKGNPDNADIIVSFYDTGGTLAGVNINKSEGTINAGGGGTLKLFLWERGALRPLTAAKTLRFGGERETHLNNVLAGADGNIHYTYILPAGYDESKTYPMLMTLPGWSNLFNTIETTPLTENRYADGNAAAWTDLGGDFIVVSPSLTDWGEKSARQTIELADYFVENFPVDPKRIYAAGFSAGGETLSRVVDMRPELFAAYLHISSQWDGGFENAASARLPVYIFIAENDEYYGSAQARRAYASLREAYAAEGMTDEEIDGLLVLDVRDDEFFNDLGIYSYHGGGGVAANQQDIILWMLGRN